MKNSMDGDPRQQAGEHLRADFASDVLEDDPLEQLERDWNPDSQQRIRQAAYDAQESTLDVDLERQRAGKERFADTVASADRWEEEAAHAEMMLAFEPDNAVLKRRLAIAMSRAATTRDQVERGRQTYEANARRWYGGTREELRVAEREAYAAWIAKEEGRTVRGYKRPAGMTPEDRTAHMRQKEREKKAAYRARKRTV